MSYISRTYTITPAQDAKVSREARKKAGRKGRPNKNKVIRDLIDTL